MKPGLLKYPGGKSYLAKRIRAQFGHGWDTYVEPFLGGGAVLLEIGPQRGLRRVGSDLDQELIDLWNEVKGGSEAFLSAVEGLPYTQGCFERWREKKPETSLERALRCLVVRRFSRGGTGTSFAWSERLRGGKPGDLNAWMNFKKRLWGIHRSVQDVEFLCDDAIGAIEVLDGPRTLFYLDPPYVHSTRVSTQVYSYEMTLKDHRRLIEVVKNLEGRCFISGYSHPLYEGLGWHRVVWDMPCHAGQTAEKSRREEVLWSNRKELGA